MSCFYNSPERTHQTLALDRSIFYECCAHNSFSLILGMRGCETRGSVPLNPTHSFFYFSFTSPHRLQISDLLIFFCLFVLFSKHQICIETQKTFISFFVIKFLNKPALHFETDLCALSQKSIRRIVLIF